MELAEHLINPDQGRVHHLLSGPEFRRRHCLVSAIATFGGRFNGGEILMVAVAIAKEEKLLHSCPLPQSNRVVAKEFAGNTDQRDVLIEQSHDFITPRSFVKKGGLVASLRHLLQ